MRKFYQLVMVILLISWSCHLFSQEVEIALLEKQAKAHWQKMEIRKAIKKWEDIIKLFPEHKNAKKALARIKTNFNNTDTYLNLIEKLVAQKDWKQADNMIFEWQSTLQYPSQQSRLFLLKGDVAFNYRKYDKALSLYLSAEALAEDKYIKEKSVFGRAKSLFKINGKYYDGLALIQKIIKGSSFKELKEEATWLEIQGSDLRRPQKIQVLKKFINSFPKSILLSQAYRNLAQLLKEEHGAFSNEVMSYLVLAFENSLDGQGLELSSSEILLSIESGATVSSLEHLAMLIEKVKEPHPVLVGANELEALAYRRISIIGSFEKRIKAVHKFQQLMSKLLSNNELNIRASKWKSLQAESFLIEGQIKLLKGLEAEAIQVLNKAAGYCLNLISEHADSDNSAGETLLRIGRLLESRGRPDAACLHYQVLMKHFVGSELGAKSLWRLARLYQNRLDQPLNAIEMLKRYQDLYPPSFRKNSSAEDRIHLLGYSDIPTFQAAHGLKVDGVLGSKSLQALRSEEDNFREILPPNTIQTQVQGKLIHSVLYGMAEKLKERGRYREAIYAYQSFLSMYPGHRLGDDAYLNIARLFKKNDLFHEAVNAYQSLILDYQKGNQTSHAYLEAAYCFECLGQWEKAKKHYDLFIKKFPRYRRSSEARKKLKAITKLIQFDGLVKEGHLAEAKLADALYEMGKILYKDLSNRQKAQLIFSDIARRFPKTYQAPDARFSAGVCFLHEENFEKARQEFSQLILDHKDSRLSDDAQYWIGHSWEHQARALGKWDTKIIALNKRSIKESVALQRDLKLRKHFYPKANFLKNAWHDAHPDLLKKDKTRELTRENLFKAVKAYRKVVKDYRLGDKAQKALLRICAIYSNYLKNPEKAIASYKELLEKFPGSKAAVDAQFQVGRHYLNKKEYSKASKAISLFLVSFPNHYKASEALLDLARCHQGQKYWLKALDVYQSYLNRYPNSSKLTEVKEKIQWIKKYRF